MAQTWRSGARAAGARPRPLDPGALERMALRYVERFATSRARLSRYLDGKLRERGWDGAEPPGVAPLVERLAALGYVDDAAFAQARAAGLVRRGFGPRRVAEALKIAGIASADAAGAQDEAARQAWDAALALARRKRIGPFAAARPDRLAREKALAMLLRAGHSTAMARRLVDAAPGEIPEWDIH